MISSWLHSGTFCRPFEYGGLTPCIVANQHLSWNFCLRDTSAKGYVPDPPSLFSRTGGSGDETNIHVMWPLVILSITGLSGVSPDTVHISCVKTMIMG